MSNGSPDKTALSDAPLSSSAEAKKGNLQHTLKRPIFCKGAGLHTGRPIRLSLLPAEVGTGIQFQRTDRANHAPFRLHHGSVTHTQLATVISPDAPNSGTISTIEHLMAAFYGMEIDNVLVQVSGPEIPILDGSAEDFSFLIRCAGAQEQSHVRQLIEVTSPVEVTGPNGSKACLRPLSHGKAQTLDLSMSIDFPAPVIGQQSYRAKLSPSLFRQEIAFCRTFVNYSDVAVLQQNGMALGGSLKNAIVVNHDTVINPAGLYTPDEFVRHKALDAVGDLYCSGYRICGRFDGVKTGHALNNRLLHVLFSSHRHWRFIPDRRHLSFIAK